MAIKKQVQINVSFTDEQDKLLSLWLSKFGKQTKGQILREIFDLYSGLYEAAEQAKLDVVEEQLRKAQLPAPTKLV